MYLEGIYVAKDEHKAFEYYMKAANLNDPSGQNNVAKCYREGRGTLASDEMAFKYYVLAARQNHAGAQNDLGLLYE